MNIDTLLKNGYKIFAEYTLMDFPRNFYQKKVTDGKGIKYFINVYEYTETNDFEIELQFIVNKFTINITIFNFDKEMTLEDIEKEIEKIWINNGSPYYEVWENDN